MPVSIRLATPDDAAEIRAIYAPLVACSAVSFERTVPSVAEMARRIAQRLETLPWLVCIRDDELLGYSYAAEHRSREAYQLVRRIVGLRGRRRPPATCRPGAVCFVV